MFQERVRRISHYPIDDPYPSKVQLVFRIIVLGFLVHLLVIMATLELNFPRPFDDFIVSAEDTSHISAVLKEPDVTDNKDISGFVNDSLDRMRLLLLEGNNHYYIYYDYRQIIFAFVVFGFVLWLIHLLIMTVDWGDVVCVTTRYDNFKTSTVLITTLVFGTIEWYFFWFDGYEYTYVMYMSFPVIMLAIIMKESRRLTTCAAILIDLYQESLIVDWIKVCITCILSITTLILCFKHHPVWFFCLLILQLYWLQSSPKFSRYTRGEGVSFDFEVNDWIVINAYLSVYPTLSLLIPVNQYFHFFGLGYFLCTILYLRLLRENQTTLPLTRFVFLIFRLQILFFTLSFILANLIDIGFIGSTSYWKVFSWILSGVPLVLITFVPCFQLTRLTAIVFAFTSYYMLISSGWDILFMIVYLGVLFSWLSFEVTRSNQNFMVNPNLENAHFQRLPVLDTDASISTDNLRLASHYIYFLMIGFFSPGNGMNTDFFDPMWTRCFEIVFSSTATTALTIIKILIPLIITTCCFRGILIMGGHNNSLAIFSYITFMADCCFLYFMLSIKNAGSWLDIYTSICFFVIMGMFILIIPLLYGIAYLLTTVYINESSIKSTLKYLKIFDFFNYQNYFVDDNVPHRE